MLKKITLFPRYAENGASSRLRQWRWRDALSGIAERVDVTPFFSETALRAFYKTNRHSATATAGAARRRIIRAICAGKCAVIEYELCPGAPAWFEKLLLCRTRYILDFDDDVWTKYEKNPLLRGKFDALIRGAFGVTVANRFLYEKAAKLNGNVLYLPTPIEKILPPQEKFADFTLAWIGSPTTRRAHLEPFAPVLRQLAEVIDFELLVIADQKPELPGVRVRFEAWSEAKETLLGKCHAGIMPLAADAFSRGKSAYKLIQYLGAGIPCVASCVGENRFVVEEGKTGFLVSGADAWCEAIAKLHADDALREKMSVAARAAAQNYLRSNLFDRYAEFLRRAFK